MVRAWVAVVGLVVLMALSVGTAAAEDPTATPTVEPTATPTAVATAAPTATGLVVSLSTDDRDLVQGGVYSVVFIGLVVVALLGATVVTSAFRGGD